MVKRNKIRLFAVTWSDIEIVIQSEVNQREKQISYINAYMWNLEEWYRPSYLQSRGRHTDTENKYQGGRVGGAERLELTYIHY